MKTTPQRLACVTLCALMLAPFAVAQPVQVNANAAVRGAASRPTLPPAAAVRASTAVNTSPSVRPQPGLNAQASSHASANAQQRGLKVAALASGGATTEEIRTAAHANRDVVLERVDSQIEVGGQITADLNRQARHLDGEAKANFKAAMKDVKTAEKAVRRSLRTARKAKGEAQADAQAQLAADYAAYTEAVARAEAAAAPTPPAASTEGTVSAETEPQS